MLCKKCGKEINNNVHCPYCKCDNHYEHENVPAHLTFIQALFDSPLSADAAVRMNAGQREDANCPAQGRFERPEQRPMPADALGTRANSGAVYDDLDEEMDEMIRKKYGIVVNILTVVACVCCLCIGFIVGGIVERGQMKDEIQKSASVGESVAETEKESETQEDLKATSDVAKDDEANIISSPFRIETDDAGEYLIVSLPVGSGNYWYDFSDLADILGADMIIQETYQQQELVDNNSVIQVFTLKLPLEKVEITDAADVGTDDTSANDADANKSVKNSDSSDILESDAAAGSSVGNSNVTGSSAGTGNSADDSGSQSDGTGHIIAPYQPN